MKEIDEATFEAGREDFEKAVELSKEICRLLDSRKIDVGLAIMAMGVGFATGAAAVRMPLPLAIDLVRAVYKQTQDKSKAH